MCLSASSAGVSSQCRLGLGRMKHIQIKFLFLQQLVKDNVLKLKKIATLNNSAHLGTK